MQDGDRSGGVHAIHGSVAAGAALIGRAVKQPVPRLDQCGEGIGAIGIVEGVQRGCLTCRRIDSIDRAQEIRSAVVRRSVQEPVGRLNHARVRVRAITQTKSVQRRDRASGVHAIDGAVAVRSALIGRAVKQPFAALDDARDGISTVAVPERVQRRHRSGGVGAKHRSISKASGERGSVERTVVRLHESGVWIRAVGVREVVQCFEGRFGRTSGARNVDEHVRDDRRVDCRIGGHELNGQHLSRADRENRAGGRRVEKHAGHVRRGVQLRRIERRSVHD